MADTTNSDDDAPDSSEPSKTCGTCGGSKKTGDQQHGIVSYMQGNAGPVNGTYYYSADGSVSQFAVGASPTSTGFSASGGICTVDAYPGSTTNDVVGGLSTGMTASMGSGAEASYSYNDSGSMTCVGATTGTPGASPTASYAQTPSQWANTLVPTPTYAPNPEVAVDQYGEEYQSNTGTLQDDVEDSLRQ